MSGGRPAAQVEVSAAVVRELLERQQPDLAHLPLHLAAEGWDNRTYRLGDELAVRLPRHAAAAVLLEHEQRWLGRLAEGLPLAVPRVVRRGVPDPVYPWRWSVLPWLRGEAADACPPDPSEAAELGRFLRALHRPPAPGAPRNRHRGVPLRDRSSTLEERLPGLPPALAPLRPRLQRIWAEALAAEEASAATWIHGDLHPGNVLVDRGRLSGVVDWGDLAQGDPATDLAAAWMLFPVSAHCEVAAAYGGSPARWARARGWAVLFGLLLLPDERLGATGLQTLARVVG